MSEIEKLYELAGVEYYDRYFSCLKDEDLTCQDNCEICDNAKEVKCYPPFTAEKQIELIKWFVTHYAELETLEITYYLNDCFQISSCAKSSHFETSFEDAIAGLINNLWKDLTSEEKQQVKGILE